MGVTKSFGTHPQFFGGMEHNFWYPHIREEMRHLLRVENIDRCAPIERLGPTPVFCRFGLVSHH